MVRPPPAPPAQAEPTTSTTAEASTEAPAPATAEAQVGATESDTAPPGAPTTTGTPPQAGTEAGLTDVPMPAAGTEKEGTADDQEEAEAMDTDQPLHGDDDTHTTPRAVEPEAESASPPLAAGPGAASRSSSAQATTGDEAVGSSDARMPSPTPPVSDEGEGSTGTGSMDEWQEAEARRPAKAGVRTHTGRRRKGSTRTAAEPVRQGPMLNPLNGKALSPNYWKLAGTRQKLPAWEARDDFLKLVVEWPIVILVGETGSGKTTQLPQFLVEQGLHLDPAGGKHSIACTQPRRLAATAVAERVAEEMDVRIGEEVGYHVRFEAKYQANTVLIFMTDGMLIKLLENDPLLTRYTMVVVDEAHERTAQTGILMALLKKLAKLRKDLRVVVMSATLGAAKFADYFGGHQLATSQDAPTRLRSSTARRPPGTTSRRPSTLPPTSI